MSPAIQGITQTGGKGEWRTPDELYEQRNRRYAFNYDPFATHENAKCYMYSTVDGTFLRGREPLQIDERDGLEYPWEGRIVFMNPPYGRGILARCVKKAWMERNEAALIDALLPVDTSTKWWHRYIAGVCDLTFLQPRVKFIDPATGEPIGSPPFASMLATYRSEIKGYRAVHHSD